MVPRTIGVLKPSEILIYLQPAFIREATLGGFYIYKVSNSNPTPMRAIETDPYFLYTLGYLWYGGPDPNQIISSSQQIDKWSFASLKEQGRKVFVYWNKQKKLTSADNPDLPYYNIPLIHP
jgi:hypothetical protein